MTSEDIKHQLIIIIIAQRLVHCAIALSTAVLDRVDSITGEALYRQGVEPQRQIVISSASNPAHVVSGD